MKLTSFSFFLLGCLAALTILSGCSSAHKATATKDSDTNLNTRGISNKDQKTIEAESKYIEATKMEMLGDHQQALNLYSECLKNNPNNDAVYYEMGKIYFGKKDYTNSLTSVRMAVKLNPANKWYQELYADVLDKTGDQKAAAKVYDGLVKQYPNNKDYYFNWAYYLSVSNQAQEAINVYDQIEAKAGPDEKITVEKVQLYLKMGKTEKAAGELQKLASANPAEPRYLVMLADLYSTNGMSDKAMETLQKLSAIDSTNPNTQLALADYYRRKGDDEKSFDALKKVFANPTMDIDVKVQILVGYLPQMSTNEKRKAEAIELGSMLTKAHPNSAKAFAMDGDVLGEADKYSDALAQYHSSIKLDNGKFPVWQQTLTIEAHLMLYDSLMNDAKRCEELFPDQSLPYYLGGIAALEKNKTDNAIKSFERAAIIGSDDKKYISQIYASLGDAYYKLKNYSASDSSYELSLTNNPDNEYTLNNYAYYLSLRGEKLDKAAAMAEKAVNLEPTNGNDMDTYGWVLYKQKKYDEAKKWIEKAMKNGEQNNGSVLEHYGNVLYQLGDINGAVEYWQKAKDNKVDSDTIDKKIADKKIYE